MSALSTATLRCPAWAWVVIWGAAAIALHFAAPRWDAVSQDGNVGYLPAELSSPRAEKLLTAAFPHHSARSQLVLIVTRPEPPGNPDPNHAAIAQPNDATTHDSIGLVGSDYEFAAQVAESWLQQAEALKLSAVWTHQTEIVGEQLKSVDEENRTRAILVVAQVQQDFMEADNRRIVRHAREAIDASLAKQQQTADYVPGMEWGLTGSAVVGSDLLNAASESVRNTEYITVLLVLGFVLLVYRAPLLAIVPMVAIGTAWWCGIKLVAWGTEWTGFWQAIGWRWQVFTTARIFITVLVFGSGTDYCLFLIARYREELRLNNDRRAALTRAMDEIGGALWASALTTIVGVGFMAFADFGKFQTAGPAIAVCLLITYFASVTLAPALLLLMGPALFWPLSVGTANTNPEIDDATQLPTSNDQQPTTISLTPNAQSPTPTSTRFWDELSRVILARPLVGWLAVTAALIYAAWLGHFGDLAIRYDLIADLPSDRMSVQGSKLLAREFAPGITGMITLVAERKEGSFADEAGLDWVRAVTRALRDFEGVDRVRSLTQPLGVPAGQLSDLLRPGGAGRMFAEKTAAAREYFLSHEPQSADRVTRFEIVLNDDPFSPLAIARLVKIEKFLAEQRAAASDAWRGIELHSGGITAVTRDLVRVTVSDQDRIMRITWLGVLAVTIMLVRRFDLCVYLMLTVLLSYFATIGLTSQWFGYWWGTDTAGIDWKVPLFLFVILIAVGQDYNIYLVARVLEEERRHPPDRALRIGLARTGGIITSCGLIMAASFVSMLGGQMRSIVEMGFALTLGVILDTMVVRTILVPTGWKLLNQIKGIRNV